MDPEYIVALVAVVAIFVVFPGMVFHYITLWRGQKSLKPDDEKMMEDLWRSAKAMERRLETLERLLNDDKSTSKSGERYRPDRPYDS